MKPKTIGIIGGAGPLAGAFLLTRLLTLAGSSYGCYRDADFPKIFLLSFPFTEMLTPDVDSEQVKRELKECLNQLRRNGAAVLAIACNTLHAFLDEDEDLTDLVHLPEMLAREISQTEMPLVLCTTTSVRSGIHKRYFPCLYPDPDTQCEIDTLIDRILRGEEEERILQDLSKLLQSSSSNTIILGCTELSLFKERLSALNKTIIDPLDLMSAELLKISFLNIKGEKTCYL